MTAFESKCNAHNDRCLHWRPNVIVASVQQALWNGRSSRAKAESDHSGTSPGGRVFHLANRHWSRHIRTVHAGAQFASIWCPPDHEFCRDRFPIELIWTLAPGPSRRKPPTALPTPAFENAHVKTMVPIRPRRCVRRAWDSGVLTGSTVERLAKATKSAPEGRKKRTLRDVQ